jgi:general secretion pathway protein D
MILVLFMAAVRTAVSAEDAGSPADQQNTAAAMEPLGPPESMSVQETSSGSPPPSETFTERDSGRDRANQGDPDPNRPRGRRRGGGFGASFDMSSMTPEQRQQIMERAGQFMRSMGGGSGNGFSGPSGGEDPNGMQSLNLNNVEMRNLIKMIGDWTGKAVIPANDDIMQIRITIYCPQKLSKNDALGLIFVALQSRGIVADQTEGRIILRPLATAKLGAIPTLGVDEPLAKIQDKTAVVEKWFQLQYYNPTNLVDMIKPLVGEHGYVMADQKTGRLAVIDTVDNLVRIEKIVQELDIPESEQSVEQVFEIQYGDPTEIVGVLQLIMGGSSSSTGQGQSSQPSSGGQGGSGGFFGGRFGGERGGQSSQSSSSSAQSKTATSVSISATTTPIRLIPVPKQKWIIVRASREDMQKISEWIKKLDLAGVTKPQQSVVPIIYADVDEVVNLVRNTLKEMPSSEMKANVVVEGLPTSHQVVIFGKEEARVMIEKMIAQLDMPKGDFFIEKTFKLKHADPDQIKKNIDGLYSSSTQQQSRYYYGGNRGATTDPKNEVKVISYPTMKQVTVIASEQNMEKITKQIEQEWDVPLDIQKDQYRILTLENSDPVKMADLLNKLFSEQQESGSQNFWRMLFGDTTESKQKIVGSLYGMLTFEPVPDTKKLIVISKIPEAYDVIERLINQLDGREGGEVPQVVVLKYADCEALCDQLNSIFNEAGTPTTIQRSNRGLSSYSADQQGGAVTESSNGGSSGGSSGNSSSSQITPWWTRQRQDTTQLPPSNLIGKVRFIPVQRSKSILILAPLKYHDDLIKMIDELDLPGMQVMIKAVIVEVDLKDSGSLGIRFASDSGALGNAGVNSVNFLNGLQAIENGSNTRTNATTGALLEGSQLSASANVNALVDLLVEKMNGRVLNQPTLWTKDNEEAIFVKGQKVAFIAGEQSDNSNLNNTTRTYTYDNVGVTLRIRPNITPEKAVDITINLNISEIETTQINFQNTRKNLDATTHMIVSDGQTIMMGGIIFQNDQKTVDKVPLLGDIPILGAVFSHTSTALTNSELLVFITPYVFDEKMRLEMPAEKNHQELMEESLNRKDEVIEQLAEKIRNTWTDPNQLP